MINQILLELGLNEKEIEVYLEILKRGKALPSNIAQATGINRATIYSVAQNLIEKGLILGDVTAKTLELTALPASELNNLIEREARKLEEKRKLASQAIEELSQLPLNTKYSVPSIKFIKENNVEEFMYKRIQEWNKSLKRTDKIWWGFQDHTFVENFKKWMGDYWEQESSRDIKVKLLSNISEVEETMAKEAWEDREIRFWKKEVKFTSTLWIVGEYIVMVYTKDKPFYLVEINNFVMSQNLREVFKNIWGGIKEDNEL